MLQREIKEMMQLVHFMSFKQQIEEERVTVMIKKVFNGSQSLHLSHEAEISYCFTEYKTQVPHTDHVINIHLMEDL